jgi:site-specific recombinase XerD
MCLKVAGIAMAQKLLGHESIQTTGLYVRVDEDRESAAVEDL